MKVMTSDVSGSGVSNVEWTTDDAASESAVWSSLTKDSSNTALWAGTVTPLVQGYNRIYVKITDRAGNSTSAELYPYVDTEVPAETVLVKVDDVAGADVDRKIVNGTADVVILLTAKDTGADSKATGIGSVSVSHSRHFFGNAVAAQPRQGGAYVLPHSPSRWAAISPRQPLSAGGCREKGPGGRHFGAVWHRV